MNPQILKFVHEYLRTGDAKQAVISAGYEAEWAGKTAKRLLRRDDVQEAIAKHQKPQTIIISNEPLVSCQALIGKLEAIYDDVTAPHSARVSAIAQAGKFLGFDRPKQFVSIPDANDTGEQIALLLNGVTSGAIDIATAESVLKVIGLAKAITGDAMDTKAGIASAEELNAIYEKGMYEMMQQQRDVERRNLKDKINAQLDEEERQNV